MYNQLRNFLEFIFKTVFRWNVLGQQNIPQQGGVVVAANHISLWDPPVLGTAVVRPFHFMAKEELFRNPLLRWLIVKLNAFPVKRGMADRNAIRSAIEILQSGGVLGVFPEGTRSKDGKLGKAEPGVAMIAMKAGVPIVPAAVIGTNRFGAAEGMLPQFTIRFGKPIIPPQGKADKETLEQLTQQMMHAIEELLAEGAN